MQKQIICINWGTRYGAPYINRLYSMVARNITPPFRFICFTDVTEGVRDEVECKPLPELRGEHPTKTRGKWGKSRLWEKDLGDVDGPVLFIDLDVAITGSLDAFFEYGSADDVVLARNMAKPLHRLGQTSVYRFPVGKLALIHSGKNLKVSVYDCGCTTRRRDLISGAIIIMHFRPSSCRKA